MSQVRTRDFTLSDRYEMTDGELYLTGLQALVRVPLEQRRRDVATGVRSGTLISGYEGSPLAGYDLELNRQRELLDQEAIVFRPGVNEELAANAVQGSQLASASSNCEYDGVVGFWYGKAPGLDRASDALRHANLGGAAPNGGAVVLVGDDSIAKSSTVPSSSESAMAELGLPTLVPSDPQEVLDFGLHAVAMSRFSGLWVGVKLATNVVDGAATVRVDSTRVSATSPSRVIDGKEYVHDVSADFLQPTLGRLERSLMYERMELASRYVAANDINRTVGDEGAKLGVIAAGATYRDTVQALERLGISEDVLGDSGVRLMKLGAINPLDADAVRAFSNGLDEVLVVEEKRPFVELAVKDALYGVPGAPRVVGKRDDQSRPLLRADSDLPPEVLAEALARRLGVVLPDRWGELKPEKAIRRERLTLPLLTRTPYFCSGCPHNRSTVVPEGSLVGAGIGCHTLVKVMPEDRVGQIATLGQMGGEGASWVGMAPFVTDEHMFQNLGDGTFHHSGSLAIRAAVAAGVNITYKLLYNDAVAMTGGQSAVGKMSVPDIVQELLAEGVSRVAITTDDVKKYRKVKLPRSVKVLDRRELIPLQEQLAATTGVTVLIHDQECATELRRKRKRGLVESPTTRAFINERLCEGCGDCGQKSNCMSVQPTDTVFGRKTKIDQASCNKDYSCLDGDCPSFIAVEPETASRADSAHRDVVDLPLPVAKVGPDAFNVRITGVGGTGVVTVAQILSTAGALAGLHVRGLDQLGLAQKGGAVVSDLKFSSSPIPGTNKLGEGECDLYLGCDLLVAANDTNLKVASKSRTVSVISTAQVPTGTMILRPSTRFPQLASIRRLLDGVSRPDDSVYADARSIAYREFGSDQLANMVLVGMAIQAGALPIPLASIDRAIELNGVAVAANRRAIKVGRMHVLEPSVTKGASSRSREARTARERAMLRDAINGLAGMSEQLKDRVGFLAADLVDYQDVKYALSYVRFVSDVAARESETFGIPGLLSETAAESMFKLMAYKDEYETARLYLDPEFERAVRDEFGDNARYKYKLHPPVLRALGMKSKISLGPWFKPAFHVLRKSRRLRGTAFDPFGYAHVRKVERELISEFAALTAEVVSEVTQDTADHVNSILAMPQEIRGYEEIKMDSVAEFRRKVAEARELAPVASA
ncbi:indolepyruvate ferredoxin oxidoreductase family protein [Gordonia sp. HNM0687]|uniref:Indolepyruvate ferredoxin oxidoreductase family protein n=2 Tax=Gordonia mangrovi TaxID=2665643 RepID=A0A6L7GV57_9ACTN|nr:indolepyruvate ferredoxin oxidoreductase family protein [Gordonia mangrovi]MXP23859.1 indolepyruvate ferredoxin oxidoreductase family protein [Gordonia mangrovi]